MQETSFISFLRSRPILNLLIVVVYYLLVTLPHEWIGLLTVEWFGQLDRATYDRYVLTFGVLIAFIFGSLLFSRLKVHPDRLRLIAASCIALTLAVLTVRYLFVINIEMVHFFQYGALAVLLFPLIGKLDRILFWIVVLGSLDEAYQYFFLAPDRTLYYDFNDVISNLIGGVFGIIILRLMGANEFPSGTHWWKAPVYITLACLSIVIVGLLSTGYLGIYPESGAPLLLVRERAPGFWSVVHPNITYHVVRPLEGLILILLVIVIFIFILRPSDMIKSENQVTLVEND